MYSEAPETNLQSIFKKIRQHVLTSQAGYFESITEFHAQQLDSLYKLEQLLIALADETISDEYIQDPFNELIQFLNEAIASYDGFITGDSTYSGLLQNLLNYVERAEYHSLTSEINALLAVLKNNSANIITRWIRACAARKRFDDAYAPYAHSHLEEKELSDYQVTPLDNDPLFMDLSQHVPDGGGAFTLLACSGLRCLQIAFDIANCHSDPISVPFKIIVLDNSQPVYTFWQAIKTLFAESTTLEECVEKIRMFQSEDLPSLSRDTFHNMVEYGDESDIVYDCPFCYHTRKAGCFI